MCKNVWHQWCPLATASIVTLSSWCLLSSQIQPSRFQQFSNYKPHYRGSFCNIKVFLHHMNPSLLNNVGQNTHLGQWPVQINWNSCALVLPHIALPLRIRNSFMLVVFVMIMSGLKMNQVLTRLPLCRAIQGYWTRKSQASVALWDEQWVVLW